ncbi:MAG: DUF151 domain-containing protein [Nanoarchaeota archaeon]|nr:DUF151 domain-containing protein [Nanoarchaeota archaeon]
MYIRRKTKKIALILIFIFAAIYLFFILWHAGITGSVVNNENNIMLDEGEHFIEYRDYNFSDREYDLKDYRKMDVFISPERVTMRDDCYVLAVATSTEKTEKLIRSYEGEFLVRPGEHDLIEEIMDVFKIELDYVAIDNVEEDIFYGHMVMHDDNKVLNLDIKPSDGLAIALRTGSPVYISNELIDNLAENRCGA